MPQFDNKSVARISAVVQKVENDGISNVPPKQGAFPTSGLLWFLLTEDFDENLEALGSPGNWSASEDNVGDGTGTPVTGGGFLTADPVARYTVRDTTKHSGAGEGDWVMCRWLGAEAGSVWEPISVMSGFDRCQCLLTGDLATGTGSINVDNVHLIKGSSPLTDPESTSETLLVYNTHAWDGDNNALCDIRYNNYTDQWEFDYIPCTT